MEPKTLTRLLPWAGSGQMVAPAAAKLIGNPAALYGVFAGGMSELAALYLQNGKLPRTLVYNDLHGDVINLARVLAQPEWRRRVVERLEWTPMHQDQLTQSQEICRLSPCAEFGEAWADAAERAFHYFCAVWMVISGKAGTPDEFKGKLSVRYDGGGGGDSAKRFRTGTEALEVWGRILQGGNFIRGDAFEFLPKLADESGVVVYSDSPFADKSITYRHDFAGPETHAQLAMYLHRFKSARVVIRYYDNELIRRLYPEDRWIWHLIEGGRKQSNAQAPEVLIESRRSA